MTGWYWLVGRLVYWLVERCVRWMMVCGNGWMGGMGGCDGIWWMWYIRCAVMRCLDRCDECEGCNTINEMWCDVGIDECMLGIEVLTCCLIDLLTEWLARQRSFWLPVSLIDWYGFFYTFIWSCLILVISVSRQHSPFYVLLCNMFNRL